MDQIAHLLKDAEVVYQDAVEQYNEDLRAKKNAHYSFERMTYARGRLDALRTVSSLAKQDADKTPYGGGHRYKQSDHGDGCLLGR